MPAGWVVGEGLQKVLGEDMGKSLAVCGASFLIQLLSSSAADSQWWGNAVVREVVAVAKVEGFQTKVLGNAGPQ